MNAKGGILMDSTIQLLREKAARVGDQETWDVFELLAAACSYCCTNYTGGNKDCPPKVALDV
jgi:hypothetical protein